MASDSSHAPPFLEWIPFFLFSLFSGPSCQALLPPALVPSIRPRLPASPLQRFAHTPTSSQLALAVISCSMFIICADRCLCVHPPAPFPTVLVPCPATPPLNIRCCYVDFSAVGGMQCTCHAAHLSGSANFCVCRSTCRGIACDCNPC